MTPRAAAAAAVVAAALVSASCGGGESEPRAEWEGKPMLVPHPELPGDRLLVGRVRNDGDDELRLNVEQARVLDADGRPVRATVRFNAGATHSLYPPRDAPKENPRVQRERLGDAATVLPGGSTPLVAAWHARDVRRGPVTVDLGPVSVKAPAGR